MVERMTVSDKIDSSAQLGFVITRNSLLKF